MSTERPVHFVTVAHERDEDGDVERTEMTFECRGDAASPCRNYPDCDCDGWDHDHSKVHPEVPQDECWLKSWFDAGIEVTPYCDETGDPIDYLSGLPEGSGPIDYEYDEGITWWWAADPNVQTLDIPAEVTR